MLDETEPYLTQQREPRTTLPCGLTNSGCQFKPKESLLSDSVFIDLQEQIITAKWVSHRRSCTVSGTKRSLDYGSEASKHTKQEHGYEARA